MNNKSAYLLIAAALLLAGCASDEQREDYKAIGEDVCRDNGGLVHVDNAGPTSVYTCGSGMTYKILVPDPTPGPLQ